MGRRRRKRGEIARLLRVSSATFAARYNGKSAFTLDHFAVVAEDLDVDVVFILETAEAFMAGEHFPAGPLERLRARQAKRRAAAGETFAGSPEELADAFWSLGIRLVDRVPILREPDEKRTPIGEIYWYPDEETIDVTPDAAATDEQVVRVLRQAENLRLDPRVVERHGGFGESARGGRWLGLTIFDPTGNRTE